MGYEELDMRTWDRDRRHQGGMGLHTGTCDTRTRQEPLSHPLAPFIP